MQLSIIIPVWNEAQKICDDIYTIIQYTEKHQIKSELIIVDDGSIDDTAKKAKQIHIPESLQLRIISYQPHRGKGHAVRTGILESSGDYVAYIDSGCNVPLNHSETGIKMIEQKRCDIVIGSRFLPESVIKKKIGLILSIGILDYQDINVHLFQDSDIMFDPVCSCGL